MTEEIIKLTAEVTGIDEATKQAERLVEILEETKTLADELAQIKFELKS